MPEPTDDLVPMLRVSYENFRAIQALMDKKFRGTDGYEGTNSFAVGDRYWYYYTREQQKWLEDMVLLLWENHIPHAVEYHKHGSWTIQEVIGFE
jgi:hypothetical protein